MASVTVTAAGETVTVAYDDPSPTPLGWDDLYAARDWDGMHGWYQAVAGRKSTRPLMVINGQLTMNASWLTANQGPHVSWDGNRWTVQDIQCRNIRMTNVNNVTIRDCIIRRDGATFNYAVHAPTSAPAHGIRIENCTIDTQQFDCFGVYFPAAAGPDDIVVARCDLSGMQSAIRATRGCTASENLIHDLYYFTGSHNTAMSFRGGDGKAYRNFVTPGVTPASGINWYAELGPTYENLYCVENIVNSTAAVVSIQFPDGDDPSILFSDLEPGMIRECVGNVILTRLSNPHLWSRCEGNIRFDGTPANT